MIKIYNFSTQRNKFMKKNKDVKSLKKLLYQGFCDESKEKFNVNQIHLDHIIPVRIGGHLFDKDNIQFLCHKCHNKKTRIDILSINILKKIGVIIGDCSFLSIEELHHLFSLIKSKIIECEENKKTYFDGQINIDYEQILWGENRK